MPSDRPLAGVADFCWELFTRAVTHASDPFRIAVVATQGPGSPARSVILRQASLEKRALVFHTDARSPKVTQLRADPRATLVFYDPQEKRQLVAQGTAHVHQMNAAAREAWLKTPLQSRLNYCSSYAPGVEIEQPDDAWPAGLRAAPSLETCEHGFHHFAVVTLVVETMDLLELHASGNVRVWMQWQEGWRARYVVP